MNEPGEPARPFAAADLGSRSFHLTVARVHRDSIEVVDRVREPVRLAAGLENRAIREETRQRALPALARIGERIREIPPDHVRVVGTNTFRQLRDPRPVLEEARRILGHRVEIISGVEEARLIYLGVTRSRPESGERNLVVDIGGGSTEIAVGHEDVLLMAESLFMGCIGFSTRFFPDGAVTPEGFEAAETEARRELQTAEHRLRQVGWENALGGSGTIRAAGQLMEPPGPVTPEGLLRLRRRLIAEPETVPEVPKFSRNRVVDLAAGVAILRATVETLGVDAIEPAEGALREGVLHDLLGRNRHRDVRDATIESLVAQYRVDRRQAIRVATVAAAGLRQVRDAWKLTGETHARFLRWAADLHEIGLSLSFSGHHRHGAYIVRNSEMPGFSRDDRELLAALIQSHRQRLEPERFASLTVVGRKAAIRLAAILRIAVLLCRRRSPEPLPRIRATASGKLLDLAFPKGWLSGHQLTLANLRREREALEAVGIRLRLSPR